MFTHLHPAIQCSIHCHNKNVKLTHNLTPDGKKIGQERSEDQLTGKGDQLTGGHGRHRWGKLDTVGEVA